MPVDFNHPLVGRVVVYRGSHPDAKPEQGLVTSVNVEAAIVFVRYGVASTTQATTASDLHFLNGQPVAITLSNGEDS